MEDGIQKKRHATFCNILEHCTIICSDLSIHIYRAFNIIITKTFIIVLLK